MAQDSAAAGMDDLQNGLVVLATENTESQDGDTENDSDNNSGDTPSDNEGPMPVEPDNGPGDGAGPPEEGSDEDEGPMPVEPDGGIGDGAGPPDEGPFPVEPDGGIGDGAGPIPIGGPFPVEPDGGIGDGAPPIAVLFPGASETPERLMASEGLEVFSFVEGGHAAIYDFSPEEDYLSFSQLDDGFETLEELTAAARNFTNLTSGEVTGVLIALGDDQVAYIEGITVEDLPSLNIDF